MRRGVVAVAVGCALFGGIASTAFAAERMYDRDVAKLIGVTNDGLGKFMGKMTGDARRAKVTREGTEVDVSDYLDDMKAEGQKLEQRFGPGDSGAMNGVSFLQKAKELRCLPRAPPRVQRRRSAVGGAAPVAGVPGGRLSARLGGRPAVVEAGAHDRRPDLQPGRPARRADQELRHRDGEGPPRTPRSTRRPPPRLTGQIKALAGGAKTLQSTLKSRQPQAML
jgi:hypothetical protein